MKIGLIRKGIIFGIIVLFVGISINIVEGLIYLDEFKYERSWNHNSLITGQQGIASNDKWKFFICDGAPSSDDEDPTIVVAELDNESGSFVSSSINGTTSLDIPYHASDPFCDSNYLMVPWSDYPSQSLARCYVYWLSNLSELPNSPYDLREEGNNYLPGVSTGTYYQDNNYWFATYGDGDPQTISYVYRFSFDSNKGFAYIEKHSLGMTEVQGIEIFESKLYFIRKHGQDDYVWSINMTTWDTTKLDQENLAIKSGSSNGPYQGITFDTSNTEKYTAYFGFGNDIFEAFKLEINNKYILEIKIVKGFHFLKIPISIKNIGVESAINISWEFQIVSLIGRNLNSHWTDTISKIQSGEQEEIIIKPVFGISFSNITAIADITTDSNKALIVGPFIWIF